MAQTSHGLLAVKVVALVVTDLARAQKFYGEFLGLQVQYINDVPEGYVLGDTYLMLKEAWYGSPTSEPNPRITLECVFAPDTEQYLKENGVVISDPVEDQGNGYCVGSFLDSEGNKLWFYSPSQK